MIAVLPYGIDFYVAALKSDKPFSFVRFGNGEWNCIFKLARTTGSKSQDLTAPGLRNGLIQAVNLDSPFYWRAIQSPGYLKKLELWPRIESYFPRGVEFHPADVFHGASRDGKLFPLIEQLRKMNVVVVGPKHLSKLDTILNVVEFIEVEPANCYRNSSRTFGRVLGSKGNVISFSAGPTAKVLINLLHPVMDRFLIDFGSLWDIYCGVHSRSYHSKITREIAACNLGFGHQIT